MTAQEIYIRSTGNAPPDNQPAYHEWFLAYVKWMERKIEEENKL